MLYFVETADAIYYSTRKLDAAFKHQEFKRGTAKFRTLSRSNIVSDKPCYDLELVNALKGAL